MSYVHNISLAMVKSPLLDNGRLVDVRKLAAEAIEKVEADGWIVSKKTGKPYKSKQCASFAVTNNLLLGYFERPFPNKVRRNGKMFPGEAVYLQQLREQDARRRAESDRRRAERDVMEAQKKSAEVNLVTAAKPDSTEPPADLVQLITSRIQETLSSKVILAIAERLIEQQIKSVMKM